MATIIASLLLLFEARVDPSPPAEFGAIAAKYGIEVVVTNPRFPVRASYGRIEGKAADGPGREAYAKLFAAEFGLYPVGLVRRARLKRVVLCDDLTFAGQRRNAIPDWEHDTLYLDVSRGAYNPTYLRKVIHHEFFHLIDYHDDGVIYGDPAWVALNLASFRYGPGGRTAQEPGRTSVLSDAVPGFLNHYSTLGVEEDKAEVFAHLVVVPATVAARAERDPVLAVKVAHLKDRLARFAPEVGATFWTRCWREAPTAERAKPPGPGR